MSRLPLSEFSVLADGLDHPEGIAWGPDGYIYAGGEAGQIYRITLAGHFTEIGNTEGAILGVCLDGDCNVYACDYKRQAVIRLSTAGELSIYSDGAADRKMVQPNFGVFDTSGNLLVSDSGGWHENNGCLFQISPTGRTRVLTTAVSKFPNGLALNLDCQYLYVVESNRSSVVRLLLGQDGSVGQPELVVHLPSTVPDGLAFDSQGTLYISCYAPDAIYALSATGELSVLVKDEERTLLSSPTNIAFCGPDLSTFVAANFGSYHLLQTKANVVGVPLNYPHLDQARSKLFKEKTCHG